MATGLSLILFILLLFLLSLGIWVAPALITLGYILLEFFTPAPVGSLLASTLWDASWNWALTALPLFIWMGEILFRTRLSSEMFKGLAPMLSNLPGGLLHVNVVGCGIMAAVAGSSAVTCATIGRKSIPELKKRNYDETLSIGSLAGSGIMIILIFMSYIAIRSKLNPSLAPKQNVSYTFFEKIKAARNLLPVVALIFFVLGSIYGGYATPTEAATIGVIGALILAWSSKSLNFKSFMASLMGAVKTSCMINFIIVGAAFLSVAMGYTGIPKQLGQIVNDFELSQLSLLAILTILYIFLGCFLEGTSMMVLTASVVLPMVQTAGIDLIWFGIFTVIVVEMAQITPPVGFNLFVLQGMTGRDILKVTKAALPFFFLMLLSIVIIVIFPQIVTAPVNFMIQ